MKKKVSLWLFVITLVWASVVTSFCFYRNPLPFPDRGHRCFAVPDKKTAEVVVEILGNMGLCECFSFDHGSTHQTLLWDNTTVIFYHDEEEIDPNGLSVAVKDPYGDAAKVAKILEDRGYASIIDRMTGDNKLVSVRSNAFIGWRLVLRRHILIMGKPSNQRKLLKE